MSKDIVSKVVDERESMARRIQESTRGRSMKQELLESELNNICEAVGCLSKATTTIEVEVGQRGTILLSLCNGCVSKFTGDIGETS